MIGALFELSWRSTRNRALSRVRRLRQTRYLISLLIGLGYFGWLLFGVGGRGASGHPGLAGFYGLTPTAAEAIRLLVLTALAWLLMLGAWALPGDRAGIEFSEAEVQFLFPAPLRRWHLLFHRVLRSLPALLLSAVALRLLALRACSLWGTWLALVVLDVYFMMAAFVRARLRLLVLGLILLPAGLVFLAAFWLAHLPFGYGPAAAGIAAVPAALVLWGESFVAARFLGKRFERLDVANDLPAGRGGP